MFQKSLLSSCHVCKSINQRFSRKLSQLFVRTSDSSKEAKLIFTDNKHLHKHNNVCQYKQSRCLSTINDNETPAIHTFQDEKCASESYPDTQDNANISSQQSNIDSNNVTDSNNDTFIGQGKLTSRLLRCHLYKF